MSLSKWPYFLQVQLTECENRAYFESSDVLPARQDCLRAFQDLAPEEVRVVILGQDPYHSRDDKGNLKAMGRAFAYHPNYKGPPNSSLLNIIREVSPEDHLSFNTSLQHWADQGVLLLNTCFTVEEDKPLSHRGKYGWELVISQTLKFLAGISDKNSICVGYKPPKHIVFVAWGVPARQILEAAGISESQMVITSHPSRYSAHAGSRPFKGSRWHEQVNDKLQAEGQRRIEWV